MNRVNSIDYLRGLMAISILLYHFSSWTIGVPQSETILGRLGIYGVSIFYIVSGMSMYISYKNTSWTLKSITSFFIRRFARLAPVYWIAMFLLIWLTATSSPASAPFFQFELSRVIYNATLTFGIFEPTTYLVTGGWSIGNEVAFYLLFPLLMITIKNKYLFATMNVVILYFYIHYSFFTLDSGATLGDEWFKYIHPLNQALLFSGGMSIAYFSMTHSSSITNKWNVILAAICVIIFTLLPGSGNQISIVTEWNRVFFTIVIFAISYFVFNVNAKGNSISERFLKFLGDISYPIYLLHGVVFDIAHKYIFPFLGDVSANTILLFCIFVLVPFLIVASYIVYKFIETPIIKATKKITVIDKKTTYADKMREEAQFKTQ
ncbi:acyltransferase family protein [Aeromonas veronii]|uniref:acyltransferase family protein n=1 Tax=Aeromonas veronii TaxID=654 RepID=UPI0015D0C838|nr:acyltransferase [Aeromonas veronii]QLH67407.1 acyltransferase [Aeromonas veronii]